MTGTEWFSYFQQRGGYAYTGAISGTTQRNNLAKHALYRAIEFVYKRLNSQAGYDKLNSLIKTNTVVVPGAGNIVNTFSATAPALSDYLHLLYVKARYAEALPSVVITDMTNTSPIVLESWYSSLRNGQQVIVTNAAGNTAANGTWFVKQITPRKFGLYTDAAFTTPSVGNGEYTSGAVVFSIFYNGCTQLVSDQKISKLQEANAEYPKVENSGGTLKFYPLSLTCSEVTIDYLTDAVVPINVADNTIDLELTYPYNFLVTEVIDEALLLFAERFRDAGERQTILENRQMGNQ